MYEGAEQVPTEIKSARIAAVAAIIAALVSGASGAFTLITSHNEIIAQTQLQEQTSREAAYAKYIADEQLLRQDEWDVVIALADPASLADFGKAFRNSTARPPANVQPPTPDPQKKQQIMEEAHKAYVELAQSSANLQLYASPAVSAAAKSLTTNHQAVDMMMTLLGGATDVLPKAIAPLLDGQDREYSDLLKTIRAETAQ